MSNTVSMNEIADVIGEDMTIRLIDEFAGRSCFFRKKPKSIEFPDQEAKEIYIFNAYTKSGMSKPDIAEYVGLSVDRVDKIIRKRDKDQ